MDKKTIIGVVLMSLIFIGYVMYNSKQQAKYQEYMTQVQAEEQARAEAEAAEMAAIEAAQPTDSLSIAQAAEAAKQREISIFGESLLAAKQGVAEQFTMSNDYITVDFTTQGGMMKKVVLAEYTKYAPKEERNEQVVLFDPETAMFDMEFYIKNGLNNVKINTSEYVFTTEGVRREADRQVLTMSLEVAAGAYLQYEYILYNEKQPARDYMLI
jgi:YidC/Oxa1 family membrane protein insertase